MCAPILLGTGALSDTGSIKATKLTAAAAPATATGAVPATENLSTTGAGIDSAKLLEIWKEPTMNKTTYPNLKNERKYHVWRWTF